MEKFRWCFIGTGKLANIVAKQIIKSGRHEIVSCFSRNQARCEEFAKRFNARSYNSAQEAMDQEDVEGVYVVTPHNAHFRYVKQALEKGKPVLCEKAFTVTGEETDELIRIARENKVYLAEAMWTWYSPCANQVKKWVDDEEIGKIKEAVFTYHMKSINYSPRVSDPRRAGGALLDITIYPITYAYRLFGYPEKILSKAIIRNGIDIADEIEMLFPGEIKVSVNASIIDFKGLEKMKISGSKGTITSLFYHASASAVLKKETNERKRFKSGKSLINSYVDEFDVAASEIREGLIESRMVSLKSTSDVMHILDEIRRQINLVYDDLE